MAWRDQIAPMVAYVIANTGTDDIAALKAALRTARPSWIAARAHLSAVWRQEARRQIAAAEGKVRPNTRRPGARRCKRTGDLFG